MYVGNFSIFLTSPLIYARSIRVAPPSDFSDEDMSVIDGELSSTSSGGGGKKGTSGLMSGGAGGNGGLGLSSKKANDRKSARARTVLSEKQLNILKTCYSANPRPDALMKEQLVEMTGLSPRVVRVWFQNKRCKDKKRQQLQQSKVRTNLTYILWGPSINDVSLNGEGRGMSKMLEFTYGEGGVHKIG